MFTLAALPAWLAALTLAGLLYAGTALILGVRRLPRLRDCPPASGPRLPRASAVIAARNEAHTIEPALASVLALDYPDLEVIAVNDRSTDDTGAVLDRVATQEPRLRVLHVTELPAGWLGKNHALSAGANAATGELLLFLDADIVLHPTALARAVGYLLAEKADHVTLGPDAHIPGLAGGLAYGLFLLMFFLFFRPWRCADPRSKCHVGIGAFNLVRAAAYRACGGHERIRLRPDDDIKLGKILKESGHRQRLVRGNGMAAVEWYPSLAAMAVGLEKNAFAGVEYSLPAMVLSTVGLLVVYVWPFVALFITGGWAWVLNLLVVLALVTLYAVNARIHEQPAWLAPGLPVAALMMFVIFWRATLLTYLRGGVAWRGTVYPLRELRANRV